MGIKINGNIIYFIHISLTLATWNTAITCRISKEQEV